MSSGLHIGTAGHDGAGLHPLDRSAGGDWVPGQPYAGARNASFAAYSWRHDLHYLVDEQREGAVNVLRRAANVWEPVAVVATHGAEPCYVALSAAQDRLAVANYASGSVACFRLDPDTGLPLDPPEVRRHAGSGPVIDRQDKAHAHCACFGPNGRWLYHVDLGTDEILAYPVDGGGTLGEGRIAYGAPAGSGPRHLLFHPSLPVALLLSELASTLTVLAVAGDTLTAVDIRSTLPDGFAGTSIGGHLALNRSGNRIYATNRGHDSVAVFAWPDGGVPLLLQHVPSGGASPRAFVLLEEERQFVLANEQAGNVTVFDLFSDGTLAPHRQALSIPGAEFVFAAPGRRVCSR